jgi:hypothetical protein
MQECVAKLSGLPAKSVWDDVANSVSQSRQRVEKVTRSTPSINTLKKKVASHILHVENRLIELDTLFPSPRVGTVEHANGESSLPAVKSTKLTKQFRSLFYCDHTKI